MQLTFPACALHLLKESKTESSSAAIVSPGRASAGSVAIMSPAAEADPDGGDVIMMEERIGSNA